MIGLPVAGELVDGATKIQMNSTIVAVEMRDADKAVITVAPTSELPTAKYNKSEGNTHKFELTISPIGK